MITTFTPKKAEACPKCGKAATYHYPSCPHCGWDKMRGRYTRTAIIQWEHKDVTTGGLIYYRSEEGTGK